MSSGSAFETLIADRTQDFTGREWVFEQINAWLDERDKPVFFLTGGPGSGKTAVAARLVQISSGAVPAPDTPHLATQFLSFYFFCQTGSEELDPLRFVTNLALVLADRFDEYAKALASLGDQQNIIVHQTPGQIAEGGQMTGVAIKSLTITDLSARVAFNRTIREPFFDLYQKGLDSPIIILIDALDEALTYHKKENLVTLLAYLLGKPQELPPNMRFILTGRPDARLLHRLPPPTLDLQHDAPDDANSDLRSYVARVKSRIIERLWVWRPIEQWLAMDNSRLFLLSGPPGSGKSTLFEQFEQTHLANHWHELPKLTQAWTWFYACQTGDPTTLDPLNFIKNLASGLANKYPAYGEILTQIEPTTQIKVEQKIEKAETGAQVTGVSIGTINIGDLNVNTAFEHFVRRPLEQLCTNSSKKTILLVVDALDEAQEYADNALANLISRFTRPQVQWPAQVRWLITSRRDLRIIHLFGRSSLDLVENAPNNDDIFLYAYDRLDLLAELDRKTLALRIAEYAEGIFLYARYVVEEAVKKIRSGLSWSDLEFPKGLNDHYREFLRRELAEGLLDWQRDYRPLLSSLVVAQSSGLTRRQLGGILAKNPDALLPLLTASAQYLKGVQPDGPFRVYHLSFQDFLEEDAEFGIDQSEAHRKIAEYFTLAYKNDWAECHDLYALQHIPVHLIEAMRRIPSDIDPLTRRRLAGQMRMLATDADFWQARQRANLALENAHSQQTLQAMLHIGSHYRHHKTLLTLLGILSVTRAPVTAEQLEDISGLETTNIHEGLDILYPEVVCDAGSGFALCQRSLATYIGDEIRNEHPRVANYYHDRYARHWVECDTYGLSWFITHLVGGEQYQRLASTLTDASYWQARLEKTGLLAAKKDLRSAIEFAPVTGLLIQSLGMLLELLQLVDSSSTDSSDFDIATTVQVIMACVKDAALDKPQSGRATNLLQADLVDRIVDKADGNFLYVRYVLDDLLPQLTQDIDVSILPLPETLKAIYQEFLYRELANTTEAWQEKYGLLVSILAVSRGEGLTRDQLIGMVGLAENEADRILTPIQQYLSYQTPDGPFRILHQSFREFLLSLEEGPIRAYPVQAHSYIASYFLEEWERYWDECDELYPLQHLSFHLQQAGAGAKTWRSRRKWADRLRALLMDFGWLQAKLAGTNINNLLNDFSLLDIDDRQDPLRLVEGALRLSAHVLAADKEQLSSQLYGRMLPLEQPALVSLREQIAEETQHPWLKLQTPTMIPPGGALIRTLAGHTGWVTSVALSGDGRTVVSGSFDETIRLWDVETGRELQRFEGHTGWVTSVALSADGHFLVSGSEDKTIRLWDVETGRELQRFEGHTARVLSVALSGDGRTVVSGSYDETIRLWELETGRELRRFEGHANAVTSVALSADSRTVVSGSYDETIRLWEVATGREQRRLEGHTAAVWSVALSGDGRTLVSGSRDRTIRLWDMETGREQRRLEGHTGWVTSVALSADGRTLVSGSWDKTIRLWDMATGRELRRIEGHTNWVTSVALSADGRTLISGSGNRTIRLWDIETGWEQRRLEGHTGEVSSVVLSGDGRTLVSGSDDETIRLWEVETGRELRRFEVHADLVKSVALSGDGLILAFCSIDKTVRLWEVETGHELRRLEGHTNRVNSVVLSEDGRTLASGSSDKNIRLWEVATGRELRRFEGHTWMVTSVALSADGRFLVSGSEDRTIRLWEVETGRELRRFEGHTHWVSSVALSADGRFLVSGSLDRTIRLWEVETGKELRRFEGHTGQVTSVALSADGRTLVSGSWDRTIRLWEVETGQEIAAWTGNGTARATDISGDGRTIVVGDDGGRVHIFTLANYE